MKREMEREQQQQYFDFTALGEDLRILILTATGHDIFACNCTSRDVHQLIGEPRHHIMERIPEFRFFYHIGCRTPRQKDIPVGPSGDAFEQDGQRLLMLKPRVIKMDFGLCGFTLATLIAMQDSLTAMDLYSCNFVARRVGFELALGQFELALGQLTNLKHLTMYECSFVSHVFNYPNHDHDHDICNVIARLTRLETLVIGSDDQFDMGALANLHSLRWLDISTEQHPTFDDIRHLTGLHTLSMRSDDAVAAGATQWTTMTNLRTLYLDCPCDADSDSDDEPIVPDLSFLPPWITVKTGMTPNPLGATRGEHDFGYYWPVHSEEEDDSSESSSSSSSSSSESSMESIRNISDFDDDDDDDDDDDTFVASQENDYACTSTECYCHECNKRIVLGDQ